MAADEPGAAVLSADVLAADLQPVATAIGEAWASEIVRLLRDEDREVIGPWPGTMSEARMRILASLRVKLDTRHLDQLARIAIVAARRGWEVVSQPDPER